MLSVDALTKTVYMIYLATPRFLTNSSARIILLFTVSTANGRLCAKKWDF